MADLQHLQPTLHIGVEIGVTDPVTRGPYHNHLHVHDNRTTGPGADRYIGGQYQHTHPHWDGHEHSTVNPLLQVTVMSWDMIWKFIERYHLQHDDPNNFFGTLNPSRISDHSHDIMQEHFHKADEEWLQFNITQHGHVFRA